METLGKHFPNKNTEFTCELCYFKCFKLSEWKRHINTIKHSYRHDLNIKKAPMDDYTPKNAVFFCDCGKSYNSHSGLWKHKKSCQTVINNNKKLSKNNDEN
jgi:hypothetical protein